MYETLYLCLTDSTSMLELLMYFLLFIISFCLIPEGYKYNFLRGLICIWDYIHALMQL